MLTIIRTKQLKVDNKKMTKKSKYGNIIKSYALS